MKVTTSEPKVKIVLAKPTRSVAAKRKPKLVPPITINPERLGGTPTIAGTRLPVVALIDYLNDDQAIANFKADFPGISDEQIQAVIERIREALEEGWLAERIDY